MVSDEDLVGRVEDTTGGLVEEEVRLAVERFVELVGGCGGVVGVGLL